MVAKNSEENQKLIWSGVGMLLYLIKHSWPDITNATWELLKINDCMNQMVFLEMHHMIKYVLNAKDYELKGNEKEPWEIICFKDSNYAGGPINRRSVSWFIFYVLGTLVSWPSKTQKCNINQLWSWMGSFVTGHKRGHVHDPVAEKHEISMKFPLKVRVANTGQYLWSVTLLLHPILNTWI